MTRSLPLLLPLLLAACGGGGGSSAPPIAPSRAQVTLAGAAVAAGASQATIELALALPEGTGAALLQAELTSDAAVLRVAAQPVASDLGLPTADGDRRAAGVVRVLLGDDAARTAAALPTGALARVLFDVVEPRIAGSSTEVRLTSLQLVTSDGTEIPVDGVGGAVSIAFQ